MLAPCLLHGLGECWERPQSESQAVFLGLWRLGQADPRRPRRGVDSWTGGGSHPVHKSRCVSPSLSPMTLVMGQAHTKSQPSPPVLGLSSRHTSLSWNGGVAVTTATSRTLGLASHDSNPHADAKPPPAPQSTPISPSPSPPFTTRTFPLPPGCGTTLVSAADTSWTGADASPRHASTHHHRLGENPLNSANSPSTPPPPLHTLPPTPHTSSHHHTPRKPPPGHVTGRTQPVFCGHHWASSLVSVCNHSTLSLQIQPGYHCHFE